MNKLLTIAIPTFNRAELLDKQLAWLNQAIQEWEKDCEILISDNCSTDNTPEIISKWQSIFKNLQFIANRNTHNIGVMPNIEFCLNAAQTKYVWVIGDDDPIQSSAIPYIINNLKAEPSLSLLVLNYSRYDVLKKNIIKAKNFPIQEENTCIKSRFFIENTIQSDIFGLGFMTSQIYRSDAIRAALNKWGATGNNLEVQVFWGAYCALQGSIKFSRDVFVEYTCGTNALSNEKTWFKVHYADLLAVYVKLHHIGYSQEFCQKLIIHHFQKQNTIRALLGGIRRFPWLGLKTSIPYLGLVVRTFASFHFVHSKFFN